MIVRNWSTRLVLDIEGVEYGGAQKMLQICWTQKWRRSKNVKNLLIVRNWLTLVVPDIKGVENRDSPNNVTNLQIVKNWSTMLVLAIEGVENGERQKMLLIC